MLVCMWLMLSGTILTEELIAEVNMSTEVVYRGYAPTYRTTFNTLYVQCVCTGLEHFEAAKVGEESGNTWTILTIFSHGAGSRTLVL